ncbi:MAG: HAD family hydrolase [bacterium]
MIDFPKYTHIIWDWNGTLLDDAWLCVDIMNGMLSARGLPLKTLEDYRSIFNFPVRDYYEKLGYDFNKEPFTDVGMEFMVLYNQRQKESFLHPGVKEVLQLFSEAGFKQFILSAREENELLTETRNLGVDHFFSGIYGLDDHYAHGKNHVGARLLKEISVPPGRLVFFGDTCHDAEVAEELGIDCILISNGHNSMERLEALQLPIVSSLVELKKML